MFKTGELLKRKIRRYVVPTVAMVVLAAITLVVCAAVSGKVVYIYDGDVVTNLKTGKLTVGEALEEAEIIPGEFDLVSPDKEAPVESNMEIHITRALPMTISDDGNSLEVFTLSKTVAEVLSENKVTYSEFDSVHPAPETAITPGMTIEIHRAKRIDYFGDGGNLTVNTRANTVAGMLAGIGVEVGEYDFTEPAMDATISEGMTVRLVRVKKETFTKDVSVGYDIEEKSTSALERGKTRIAREGRNGVKTETYEVVYHDKVEVSTELVSSEVTKAPVNKIIEKGTAAPKPKPASQKTAPSAPEKSTSSGTKTTAKGESFSYRKKITCTATAYDLSYESCGKNPGDPYYGITASGMKAGPGVIAVDPSVIPLGTRLYIEAADGSWTYGYCVAGDTGSGIYGNRVDLFFNTREEVRSFGRRSCVVYVL